MKIAVITQHVPSNWAHSINTMKHAQGFFKLGYDVEILVINRFQEVKNKLRIPRVHDFYAIDRKIKIRYFTDRYGSFFNESKRFNRMSTKFFMILKKILPRIEDVLDVELNISRYCKKKNFNFVYCRLAEKAAFFNILNGIPTVIESHHNADLKQVSNHMKLALLLRKKKQFKGIITVYKILKDAYIRYGVPENKIIVIEDSVDLEKFDHIPNHPNIIRNFLKLPLNKKIILYTGSLGKGKGIKIIMDAIMLLKKEDYIFYIIGGSSYEIKNWKRYGDNIGILEKIKFLGFKENILIPFYLKSADILLAPYSLKSLIINWISPIKIFEYMASKVPIIASNIKRLKEICNFDECLFFKVDDPEDLALKISSLIKDKDLQIKLVENAYKKSLNHTYKKRCQKILFFLNN